RRIFPHPPAEAHERVFYLHGITHPLALWARERKPSSEIKAKTRSDGVKRHLISSFFTPHALNDFPFHGTDQGEDGTDGLNPSAGRIDQDTVFSAPFFLVT